MRKFCFSIAVLIALTGTSVNAQSSTPKKDSIAKPQVAAKIYGFLRNDLIYDSRQMASANDAELSLFPLPPAKDANGTDINAAGSLQMAAILTRVGLNITGPDAFGAKTSGIIEGEFWGVTGNPGGYLTNLFNLRHAYAMLDWKTTQLAFGQYWHPMFHLDCYPGVINFNTGIPFSPLNRSPQIRLTQKLDDQGHFTAAVTAISQIDMPSPQGNVTLANGITPNLDLLLQYKTDNFLLGGNLDYLSVLPSLSSPGTGLATTQRANATRFSLFTKIILDPIQLKASFTSGGNLADQVMLGGYLGYNTKSTTTEATYTATKTSAFWVDLAGTGKSVVPGIFFGTTSNNGAGSAGGDANYVLLGINNVKNVTRVAPRIEFISGKFRFGAELEFNTVAWGTYNNDGTVSNTSNTSSTRFIFMSKFSF